MCVLYLSPDILSTRPNQTKKMSQSSQTNLPQKPKFPTQSLPNLHCLPTAKKIPPTSKTFSLKLLNSNNQSPKIFKCDKFCYVHCQVKKILYVFSQKAKKFGSVSVYNLRNNVWNNQLGSCYASLDVVYHLERFGVFLLLRAMS